MFTFGVAVADYVIKAEKFVRFSELRGGVLRETSLLDIFALFVVLFSIFFLYESRFCRFPLNLPRLCPDLGHSFSQYGPPSR